MTTRTQPATPAPRTDAAPHLVNHADARDWTIKRATVTAEQPDDDAGAGIEEDDDDPPTCPACGSTDAAPLGTLGGLHWRRCKSCGIDYSQPQEAPR